MTATNVRKIAATRIRIKNKKSSVYSGDALRNNEVFQGTFIIPALEEDEEDALGQLGNTECRHCGALR